MAPIRISEWRKLPLSLTDLCIETTLRCGQSFRWRKIDDEWNCVLYGRLLSLKQDKTHLHYKVISSITPSSFKSPSPIKGEPESESDDDTEALLRHYFSLKHDLTALYDQWSNSDPNFRKKAPKFTGIRILSQSPWEALIAFICSSNNNISRISQMVHKLCIHYGPLIGHIGDEAFHDFPTPQALSGRKVEAHLRELGFGYRAKYIAETARLVTEERPEAWLESLINPDNPGWQMMKADEAAESPSYRFAHEQLLLLSGVGPKVADCVCLMGLGWDEAIPVDTHVWQIAQRDYKFGKVKTKTFSKAMYDAVGDHFREIWGKQAGWAQSVLFTANLKSFSEQASGKAEVVDIKVEVKEVKEDIATIKSTSRSRKRRQVEVTEVVKTEEHTSARSIRASKRRRAES
ncbi:8-oxoguanine DNA-glycosylase [Annulohypoxylon maeteangense]|uniref:8-oxoguanine DNA-glycosylase n=1 Tax=Annulohypoxylon maeteangense TaxID=1927788 RepID=UPI0020082A58|nr:8-oxoguanine DNA-glycosylase [Annulohypoxylon maeteangense]KAI0889888.1 8-oxoguanine DNA-glycosylase [Annulohypoxylon maeteangense]